jgi:hypothetical protein
MPLALVAIQPPSVETRGCRARGPGQPVDCQQIFQVATQNPCLNTGGAILSINPFNFVHAAHVQRNHHARLTMGDLQGIAYIRAAAIGDKADVVFARKVYDFLAVCFAFGPNHQVYRALKILVQHSRDLVGGCLSVAMNESLPVVGGVLFGFERPSQRSEKRFVAVDGRNMRILR